MITVGHYLLLAALLFSIGLVGVLTRKSAVTVFMCIELMLNATNINFVAFSAQLGNLTGQVFVFFALTVAAAEVAVGLAIIIALYRHHASINVDDFRLLKW